MLEDGGEQQLTVIQIPVKERDKWRNNTKISGRGGSSKPGVRRANNVTGSMLTQTSFSLLTINVCVCLQLKCLTAQRI